MPYMTAIRDRLGRVVLWLLDDRFIDLGGNPVGFVRDEAIFDYNGIHRGQFAQGVIRDHGGYVAGYIYGARGLTVIPPIPRVQPVAPIPKIEPVRPVPQIPRVAGIPKLQWSQFDPISIFGI